MEKLIYGFLYLIVLLLLIAFSDSFSDFAYQGYEIFFKTALGHWNRVKSRFLTYRFRQLVGQLLDIEEMTFLGLKTGAPELSQYKFYTNLVHCVWSLAQTYGVPIRKILQEIRLGLIEDGKFERRIYKEFVGGIVQFLLLTGITWGFIHITQTLVSFKCSAFVLAIISGLQIMGLLIYWQVFRKYKSLVFAPYSGYFHALYSFKSLSSVGVSMKIVLEKSNISKILAQSKKSKFQGVNQRFEKMLARLQKKGMAVKGELEEISGELWYLLDQEFCSFSKRILVVKFMIITLFYLSSYFLFLFSLFELFLIE